MRDPKRILIIHKTLFKTEVLKHFLNTEDLELVKGIQKWHSYTVHVWMQNPDLRFGQLLCNIRLIKDIDIENHIWNIEETIWLIDNNYFNFEDLHFWGINYFKNGKKRVNTKYKLLRELDTEHIKNILIFFEKNNAVDKIPKRYLNYFKNRLNE